MDAASRCGDGRQQQVNEWNGDDGPALCRLLEMHESPDVDTEVPRYSGTLSIRNSPVYTVQDIGLKEQLRNDLFCVESQSVREKFLASHWCDFTAIVSGKFQQ